MPCKNYDSRNIYLSLLASVNRHSCTRQAGVSLVWCWWQGRIQKLGVGGATSSVRYLVTSAPRLDNESVESETPKASRVWGMERGIPLPS